MLPFVKVKLLKPGRLRAVVTPRPHLQWHDMGDSVHTELAAGPLFSRLFANWSTFNRTLQSAQGNDRLTPEDAELMWANVQLQHGHRMNHLVIQYLKDRRCVREERAQGLCPVIDRIGRPLSSSDQGCQSDDTRERRNMPHLE
jgi:hypothetical protein